MDEARAEPSLPNLNLTEVLAESDSVVTRVLGVTNTSLGQWPDWSLLLRHQHHLCSPWAPLHHLYHQLAALSLLLATLAPLRAASLTVLGLRVGLVLYSLLVLLDNLLISTACHLDTIGWALILLIVNMIYTIHGEDTLRPRLKSDICLLGVYRVYVTHCTVIQQDLSSAFDILFKPLGVSRAQYKVRLDLILNKHQLSVLQSFLRSNIEVSPIDNAILSL